MMHRPAPERPKEIDPLAEAILARLQSHPVARFIVLGGYFALKHYHDYRITHDVDAWWAEDSRESDREKVRAALKAVIETVAGERGLTLTDPERREQARQTRAWFARSSCGHPRHEAGPQRLSRSGSAAT